MKPIMASSPRNSSTHFSIFEDDPEPELSSKSSPYTTHSLGHGDGRSPAPEDTPVQSIETDSAISSPPHFQSGPYSPSPMRRTSNLTRASSISSLPSTIAPDADTHSFTPMRNRPLFRSPASVRAMQLASPEPFSPRARGSPSWRGEMMGGKPRRSETPANGTPNFSHTGSVRSTHDAHQELRQSADPRQSSQARNPLILLHATILPPEPPPYSESTLSAAAPQRVLRAWKLLREKVDAQVLGRGVLIPHPRGSYELLEKRVLESLELVEGNESTSDQVCPGCLTENDNTTAFDEAAESESEEDEARDGSMGETEDAYSGQSDDEYNAETRSPRWDSGSENGDESQEEDDSLPEHLDNDDDYETEPSSPSDSYDQPHCPQRSEYSSADQSHCRACGKPLKLYDTSVELPTISRCWDVRVYAANGLMRKIAWTTAWREMERVDVQIGVWIGEEDRNRLEECERESQVEDERRRTEAVQKRERVRTKQARAKSVLSPVMAPEGKSELGIIETIISTGGAEQANVSLTAQGLMGSISDTEVYGHRSIDCFDPTGPDMIADDSPSRTPRDHTTESSGDPTSSKVPSAEPHDSSPAPYRSKRPSSPSRADSIPLSILLRNYFYVLLMRSPGTIALAAFSLLVLLLALRSEPNHDIIRAERNGEACSFPEGMEIATADIFDPQYAVVTTTTTMTITTTAVWCTTQGTLTAMSDAVGRREVSKAPSQSEAGTDLPGGTTDLPRNEEETVIEQSQSSIFDEQEKNEPEANDTGRDRETDEHDTAAANQKQCTTADRDQQAPSSGLMEGGTSMVSTPAMIFGVAIQDPRTCPAMRSAHNKWP